MKILSKALLLVLMLFFIEGRSFSADSTSPPQSEDLVSRGKLTARKLATAPASWTMKCRLQGREIFRVLVTRGKSGQAWSFWQIEDGHPEKICVLLQLDNIWYVQEVNHVAKTRPFEAEFHFPAAYSFLSASEPRFFLDVSQVASAHFEGREKDKVSYRLPLPNETRRALESVVADYRKMAEQDLSFLKQPRVAQTLRQAQEQLTNGVPLSVDEKTGMIVESKVKELTVIVEDFHWLESEPSAILKVPDGVKWSDYSQPWPESDYENCIMVGHDPLFEETDSSKLAAEGYILNLRTGELRRIPYQGAGTMPGCFLKDRRDVLVSGIDLFSGTELLKINLPTGTARNVESALSNGGLGLIGETSPDGKKAAVLRMLSGKSVVDFQIELVDLQSGQMQELGEVGRIGGPCSWLPDGDGLILKRFEENNDPNAVEKRILCRMGFDGRLVDLRPGDMPLVLRKARKILYQDDKTDLWHTCNLDGSASELYADGLKGYGTPAVSPNESQIVFTRYEKGKLPQLVMFDMGASKGKPIVDSGGFTGMPIWR